MKKPKFKVGDRVAVVENYLKGRFGIIVGRMDGKPLVRFEITDCFSEEKLRKVK